jgi:hypothetical protein
MTIIGVVVVVHLRSAPQHVVFMVLVQYNFIRIRTISYDCRCVVPNTTTFPCVAFSKMTNKHFSSSFAIVSFRMELKLKRNGLSLQKNFAFFPSCKGVFHLLLL